MEQEQAGTFTSPNGVALVWMPVPCELPDSAVGSRLCVSTCEWQLDEAINCSAELRLSYWLDFDLAYLENHTCIPENSADKVCACHMLTEGLFQLDSYRLDLWAGQQLLWQGAFRPSDHVKPRAPGNLTVHNNISDAWLLTWSNPYPPNSHLYKHLAYLVNISREDNSADFTIHNVTYLEPSLRLEASTLKSGVFYQARVRAWAQKYSSAWSEWSPSIRWHNYYQPPLEQRLRLGVSVSCIIILVICLSCYLSITWIKKVWWDQIPTPARSPLVAIIIQDSQVPSREKQSLSQEPAKCPRWKTCLTKLLPCFLEHDIQRDKDSPKTSRNRPLQGPGKPVWCPMEASGSVLWPESVNLSVVRCMELFEAPMESEEEEEEEADKGDLCVSPESSGGGFQEGRAGIVARLTEDLFVDLLGPEAGTLGKVCPSSPSGSPKQPFHLQPSPDSLTHGHSTTSPACTQVPIVIEDNPAYRSFSDFHNQSPSPEELASDPQWAGHPEEGSPPNPCVPQPSATTVLQTEPESWEQILRLAVLQHGTAAAPTPTPASGYREFMQVVKQGGVQDSGVADFGPSGEVGYKAFSSLLTSNALCMETAGAAADSGDGGYKPFQNLVPDHLKDPHPSPMPLFTFGLDTELPSNPPDLSQPSSTLECLDLEPAVKVADRQKPLCPTEQLPQPLGDDLGLGIVYSALTCHLCGHLKQHRGKEENGQVLIMSSPCCGCHCGDRRSLLESPFGALDPMAGGLLPKANLSPVLGPLLGVSEEAKASLLLQPTFSHGHHSSQTPKVEHLVPMEALGMTVS
uniref:interleukin-4 receptor subunit alpha isoform X2 n=1 Tax=Jaculus jaculus TaxID=51337 RepID=UPI001E1B365D|nr:interleukin-4 receptor subunit alpha isoform X2 [Jaculus jaculus]